MIKIISPVFTIILLVVVLLQYGSRPIYAEAGDGDEGHFKLLVIHTNDMHSRFLETDEYGSVCSKEHVHQNRCYGGFARVKRAVDDAKLEADRKNVSRIFLNAGDMFQGSVFYSILKWKVVADLIQPLGIDVMCLGNHEFDDGVQGLVPYLRNISVPVVAANVNVTFEPDLNLPILTASKVLQVANKKIGIVGYLTPDTKDIASSIGNVVITKEIPSIQKEAQKLKKNGVDIIIALGHSGYDVDVAIAENVPEISAVVGGHSHSLLYTPKDKPPSTDPSVSDYPRIVKQSNGRIVPVVQAGCYTKYLGKLWLTFDAKGDVISAEGNTVLLDHSVEEDESVLAKVKSWGQVIEQKTKEVSAVSKVFLEGDETNCRHRECNLGNFIADSFVDYVTDKHPTNNHSWTSAPIAIVQGGSIRSNIKTGNVTYGDIITFLPFENELMKVRLSGRTLKKILEHAVYRYVVPPIGGEFIQVAGLHVTYDMNNPPNDRLVTVKARCGNCSVPQYFPVDDDSVYDVVMSEYLQQGKDGFNMIKDEAISSSYTGITDTRAIDIYLLRQTFIYPEIQERITIIPEMSAKSSGHVDSSAVTYVLLFAIINLCAWINIRF